MAQLQRYGVRELNRTDCTITESAKSRKVTSVWETSSGITVKQVQVVTPVADGFSVKETIVIPKQLEDLARVGINFEIDGQLETYTYFGSGPHETYPDRSIGRVHRWISSVADQYVPYVRPQENGGHAAVRYRETTSQPLGGGYRVRPYDQRVRQMLRDSADHYRLNRRKREFRYWLHQ